MKTTIKNNLGEFTIEKLGGRYYVSGNRAATKKAFAEINRRPPNEYGNFHGREKAGFAACEQLIKNAAS